MWFKVDDKLHSHPKWIGLGSASKALWVTAGSWSADQLTDGYVPTAVLSRLGYTCRNAEALTKSGLWDAVEGGYQFHDWTEYQPTRTSVEDKRIRDRERIKKWREEHRKKAS